MQVGAKMLFAATGCFAALVGVVTTDTITPKKQTAVLDFFQQHLRQPLFAGLLTVSAFLFSLKTFIIVTMKQNVYGTDEYGADWNKKKELNPNLKRYQPLRNFALLLFFAVLISLCGAVAQFTVGLIDAPWAAIMCLSLAIWSIAMIFVALLFLQVNLRSWFHFLDESSK